MIMNAGKWLFALVAAVGLVLVGCGKSNDKGPVMQSGPVDVNTLIQAFPNPEPAAHTSLDKIRGAIRYRDYPTALTELQNLANDAKTTDAQKKVVNDFAEQIRKAVTDELQKAAPDAK